MTTKVDDKYIMELGEVMRCVNQKKRDLALPELAHNQQLLLASKLPFSTFRAASYLWANQGAKKHEISQAVAVGNVSEAFIGRGGFITDILDSIGIRVTCTKDKAMNRYGTRTVIGHFWLEITNRERWEQAQAEHYKKMIAAANDDDFKQSA